MDVNYHVVINVIIYIIIAVAVICILAFGNNIAKELEDRLKRK